MSEPNNKLIGKLDKKKLFELYKKISTSVSITNILEKNRDVSSKYVHATSRGHELVQYCVAEHIKTIDYIYPYYRDDSLLLGIGINPYQLFLQVFAKQKDIFSGGKTYYSHPSLNQDDFPKIPHQSSATGMQAIPAAGAAMGLKYMKHQKLRENDDSIVLCSLGDACITEGEVSEAFHIASLHKLPIVFLVQDNNWDISAHKDEIRMQNAYEYAKGFKLEAISIDGQDIDILYYEIKSAIELTRKKQEPILIHVEVPLLNHHTSGVRMEWYRDDIEEHKSKDAYQIIINKLVELGESKENLDLIYQDIYNIVEIGFHKAKNEKDPDKSELYNNILYDNNLNDELGEREPLNNEPTLMVDCALKAIDNILENNPNSLLYGQDVGARLGGVFREAANLAKKYGNSRVFNTPIQEAFIIGSTVGMSAVGCKPIVEVQFADYLWPGLNQLFTELSRSYYLSNGKWPVSCIIRVPIGAYGSGGPYHSSSIESVLANIKGIKIAYPSNGADLYGLINSAFIDNNPCIILEHKGLYWSKIKGSEKAKTILPSKNYTIPFGKARIVKESLVSKSNLSIVTYGRGVYWALEAANDYDNIEIIDLRTIYPIDINAITNSINKNNRCLIISEEPSENGFPNTLSSIVYQHCFENLDAPIQIIGSKNTPAIPLNENLEIEYLPSIEDIKRSIDLILNY